MACRLVENVVHRISWPKALACTVGLGLGWSGVGQAAAHAHSLHSTAAASTAQAMGQALAAGLSLASPIGIDYSQRTDAGGRASLSLTAHETISNGRLLIVGSDGSKLRRSVNLSAGKSLSVQWMQSRAQVSYKLTLESDDVSANWNFDVVRAGAKAGLGSLKITSSREDIVDYHRVSFRSSFDLVSHRLQVFSIDGEQVIDEQTSDIEVRAGVQKTLSWSDDSDVFMVSITGQGADGRVAEFRVVPWSVEIPHTDVTFDSGKWDIKPEQRPKLDEAFAVLVHELDRLEAANVAVGGDIKAQLYIAGYTDSVGSARDNQKLSRNRAREIAQYFLDAGAWCEIFYAGMGEKGQAVATADGVDMEANRRALYVLSPDAPRAGYLPTNWQRLSGPQARRLSHTPELPAAYFEHSDRIRAERIAKRGGPAGGGDSEVGRADGSSNDAQVEDRGRVEIPDVDVDTSYESLVSDDGAGGGPPALEGEPGATKQGCTVHTRPPALWVGGLALLLGLRTQSRRRRGAAG